MAVITRLFFRGSDEVIVRRAPANKVYLVEAISCVFQSQQNNTVYIFNRHLKPGSNPVFGVVDSNITPSIIAAFKNNTTINQHALWIGSINERTKYLSVGYQADNPTNFVAVVYGEIVSETKSNLLWEFITKRHR